MIVLWKNKVESEVIWLQQVESMNHKDLLEVIDNAIEDRDKTWWISSLTWITVRAGVWDGVSRVDLDAGEATATTCRTTTTYGVEAYYFLSYSLQHSLMEWSILL